SCGHDDVEGGGIRSDAVVLGLRERHDVRDAVPLYHGGDISGLHGAVGQRTLSCGGEGAAVFRGGAPPAQAATRGRAGLRHPGGAVADDEVPVALLQGAQGGEVSVVSLHAHADVGGLEDGGVGRLVHTVVVVIASRYRAGGGADVEG